MTDNPMTELINAAYQVATYPSIAAYRSGAYSKKVAHTYLRRLLVALDGLVKEEGQGALRERVRSLDAAETNYQEAVRQSDIRQRENAERADALRHPFAPGFRAMGHGCNDCHGYRSDSQHFDAEGVPL